MKKIPQIRSISEKNAVPINENAKISKTQLITIIIRQKHYKGTNFRPTLTNKQNMK